MEIEFRPGDGIVQLFDLPKPALLLINQHSCWRSYKLRWPIPDGCFRPYSNPPLLGVSRTVRGLALQGLTKAGLKLLIGDATPWLTLWPLPVLLTCPSLSSTHAIASSTTPRMTRICTHDAARSNTVMPRNCHM
jgi:hypothetical protein